MSNSLEMASKGISSSKGGLNVPMFRRELIYIYPEMKSQIDKMVRSDLELLAIKHFEGTLPCSQDVNIVQDAPIFDHSHILLEKYLMPLDPESLNAACRTSKEFADVCRDENFWRQKIKYDYGIDQSEPGVIWKDQWIKRTIYPPLPIHKIVVEYDMIKEDNPRLKDFTLTVEDINLIQSFTAHNSINVAPETGEISMNAELILNNDFRGRNVVRFTFVTQTLLIQKEVLLWMSVSARGDINAKPVHYTSSLLFDVPNVRINKVLPLTAYTARLCWEGDGRPNIYQIRKIEDLIKDKFDYKIQIDTEVFHGYAYVILGIAEKYDNDDYLDEKIREINLEESRNYNSVLRFNGGHMKLMSQLDYSMN